MKPSRNFLPLFLAAIFGQISPVPAQQRPSLDVPTLDPNGGVNLIVHGDRGTNYAVEASTDLTVWWKLFSGFATNGEAHFAYLPPPGSESRYFRTRVDVPLPPLNVAVQLDTNNVDVALLTPSQSARLSLTDDNGTTFTLTVPTNAVTDAQVIYMTVVTNLTGLPFAAGGIGGVLITPADLDLQALAQLEITFSTNATIDPVAVSAYGFDEDGSFLRLALDFPAINGITIPVLSLGGFGCSIATLTETEELSQRPVSASADASVVALDYPLDTCHPDQLKRAVQVNRIIHNRYLVLSFALSAAIHAARLADPLLPIDPVLWAIAWPGNADAFWHDFYQQTFAPFLREAESNCALTQVMARRVSALDAMENRFGVRFLDSDNAHSSLCAGYENCLQGIDQCCNMNGLDGQESVDSAKALADKAAALRCLINPTVLDKVSKDCLRTNWSGSIDVLTFLDRTNIVIDGSVTTIDTSHEVCFVTFSTGSTGLGGQASGASYYGISGLLDADGDCSYNQTIITTDTSCCQACIRITTAKSVQVIPKGLKQAARCAFIWQLTNNSPPPITIPLQNVVVPQPNLIVATQNVRKPVQQDNRDWAGIKGIACRPNFSNGKFVGTRSFSGILNLNLLTVPQGTANHFEGSWGTNYVSSDGFLTTRIITNWEFNRGVE